MRRLLRDGDEAAFRALYRRHTPKVYGLAMRLTGYLESDAQDAVQETWLRAVEKLDRFEWRSGLDTWLCAIAVNCCREIGRRRSRATESRDFAAVTSQSDRFPDVDLQRALAQLPDGYREVLVLHDVEGYTHEEIGGLLGVSTGTSKSQLSRARRAMRELLAGSRRNG